ncbi:MAG: serine/threonine-protein kinase, partial [Acidobacteriota bacterium]
MLTIDRPSSLKEWAERSSASFASFQLLPPGMQIGQRYEVVELLGRGGMGAVYRVRDRHLDRDVALKLIRPEIADDTATLERFKREIQLSSVVTHKNVLRIYDLGESDGIKFLTMHLVAGDDLAAIAKREGKLPIPRILRIFRQICEGLRAAHEQGVIHRDLKPENVMVSANDAVYLTDFGLAKSLEQSGMTQTGAILGTPYYMSPEQVKGGEADVRSDIYALGVMLYEMCAGQLPFTGRTPYEVMAARLQKTARPVSELNAEVPSYLRKIIDRCLAVDPKIRYQTIDEILADLDAETFRPTLRYAALGRRWVRPTVIAAVAAVVLAVAGWLLYRSGRGSAPAPHVPGKTE